LVLNVTYWDAINYNPPKLKNETHIEWYLNMIQYIPENVLANFINGDKTIRNRLMDFYQTLEFSTGPASDDTLEVQVIMARSLHDFSEYKISRNNKQ
jgi:hypothetical protein